MEIIDGVEVWGKNETIKAYKIYVAKLEDEIKKLKKKKKEKTNGKK